VISLKAETHNFPTTVEPFNGAATGTGGEIRDRLGGGRASLPIAGTAVYMTSYPRLSPEHKWELASNPSRLALSDTRRDSDQGLERRFRFRQQVRPAADLRLTAHVRT